ncbi:peptidoglycan-binding protein [Streptomyces sp. NPDC006335]|uniref:peptidoglycan-binding protein n=1 Tax=Streptomyces sp. NPDC006335 TaxID=3156895 RepID=UPI0033B8591D
MQRTLSLFLSNSEVPMPWEMTQEMESGDVVSILGIDHVFYEDVMRTRGTPSWNNNNPGNIVSSGEAENYGAYHGKRNDIFAIFPSEEQGLSAVRQFLLRRKEKTILQMMHIYAPSGHGSNNPEVYALQVATALGVSTNTLVSQMSQDQVADFAREIKRIEGWREGQVHGPDDLPDDVNHWLAKFSTRAERRAADQPFAKQGSPKSEGIKNIQQRLNDLGRVPALVADGIFGPKTEAAAKWFQAGHGLSVDGIVGNNTWKKLAQG